MLLVHGIGSNRKVWDRMRPFLEPSYDVIAIDLPGFGESAPLYEQPRTVARLADAIEEEMDRQGLDQGAHLVGNSMGGWLVLELARRGRARTVTAISPVGGATPNEGRVSRQLLRAQRLSARLSAPAAGPLSRPRLLRKLAGGMQMTHAEDVPPEVFEHAVRSLAKAPSWRELLNDITGSNDLFENNQGPFSEITAPVLLAWGDKDKILSPRGGPRLAEAIPGAELRELPGFGHVPMLDRPREVSEVVLAHAAAAAQPR
jgi:pimeloyl-ACP methyl ester carboxylesterase